jgi:hypothetical protein
MGIFDKLKNFNQPKTPYAQLEAMIIPAPSINLNTGEVCFYQGEAEAACKTSVITGSKGNGASISLRIAKGVAVQTGKSKNKMTKKTVLDKYPGTLYITNQRVMLLAPMYGFNIPIPEIIQFQRFKDGYCVYHGSKSNLFITHDVDKIANLIELMNAAQQ